MIVLMTDARFNSVALIVIALVTTLGTIVTVVLTRQVKSAAGEARDNAAEAKETAERTAHEVMTNGGMSDPNPNLNDHVKYQTQMMEEQARTIETLLHVAMPLVGKVDDIDRRFTDHLEETAPLIREVKGMTGKLDEHIQHSKVMDKALAEVYLTVKPDVSLEDEGLKED